MNIKMKQYDEVESVSIEEFSEILLRTGTTWYALPFKDRYAVSDVTLNEKNINGYLPQERHLSDGTCYTDETVEGDLLELLEASEGGKVVIHNSYEAYVYTIKDGEVVLKEWGRDSY